MPLIRLVYFSERAPEVTGNEFLEDLRDILEASSRNNKERDITGALLFDSRWFIQALEGEREQVWTMLRHIEKDNRHVDLVIVEAIEADRRLFANWWMGFITRNEKTAFAFAPDSTTETVWPERLTAKNITDLMIALGGIGRTRKLALAS